MQDKARGEKDEIGPGADCGDAAASGRAPTGDQLDRR